MALAPHATTEPDRRPHDRRHRSAFGVCRPAQGLDRFHGHAGRHAGGLLSFPKQPEGDRVLPLASPPPARGRGPFSDTGCPGAQGAAVPLWREMMGRWLEP